MLLIVYTWNNSVMDNVSYKYSWDEQYNYTQISKFNIICK